MGVRLGVGASVSDLLSGGGSVRSASLPRPSAP